MSDIVFNLPRGLDEIIDVYGLPPSNIEERVNWEKENLFSFTLPFAVNYTGDMTKKIKHLLFHKKLQNVVENTFSYLKNKGFDILIKDCGGSYMYRTKRMGGNALSTHAFGIAIDINCLDNPLGRIPSQPYFLVNAFLKYGWVWGGMWKIKDGMHFQYCSGY